MGDWNRPVGKDRNERVMSSYELGNGYDRVDWLVEFCKRNKLTVINRWLENHNIYHYTWKNPQFAMRYDYTILGKQIHK